MVIQRLFNHVRSKARFVQPSGAGAPQIVNREGINGDVHAIQRLVQRWANGFCGPLRPGSTHSEVPARIFSSRNSSAARRDR